MAEAVVVGVRVRPFNDRERKLGAVVCLDMNGGTTIIYNHEFAKGKDMPAPQQKFTFDESFWSHDGFEMDEKGYARAVNGSQYADQRYVFDVFGKRVLDNAWAGFHCCLFAYGQTGAGKSYSMVGYGVNKGIVPVCCEEIFQRIGGNTNPELKYEVTTSMIEIYNEAVQDLLIPAEDRPKRGLEIRESKLLGIFIEGVTKRPVQSYTEIEHTIEEATEHRTVGATLMNATSSRAHTVVTVEFKQVEGESGRASEKVSMINLVDLAGSEKAGQTGAIGERLKEGAAINKSLSALGNVIEKLAQASSGKKNIIIPYRDSKLTRLLQNALGGSSKTIMICALSPASSNYEETLSTLRYADRAKKIKNVAKVNENPMDKLLRQLREENAALKAMMEEMKTNGCDNSTLVAEKQKMIAEAEAAYKEMTRSFEDKLSEAKAKQVMAMAKAGYRLRETCKLPHMVNLNEDRLLSGRIRHVFPAAATMVIGQSCPVSQTRNTMKRVSVNGAVLTIQMARMAADDGFEEDDDHDSKASPSDSEDVEANADILLYGDCIFERHAAVTNIDGVCFINAEGMAAGQTFVNGLSLADVLSGREKLHGEEPQSAGCKLHHGDRMAFGQSCIFVFVNPSEGSTDSLILSCNFTWTSAVLELESSFKKSWECLTPQAKSLCTASSGLKTFVKDREIEELRAQLQTKDKELAELRMEVAELRAERAGRATFLDAMKSASFGGAGPPPITKLAPQLEKAKGLAVRLRAGYDQTAGDLEGAKASLDAVQEAVKAIRSLQTKGSKTVRFTKESRASGLMPPTVLFGADANAGVEAAAMPAGRTHHARFMDEVATIDAAAPAAAAPAAPAAGTVDAEATPEAAAAGNSPSALVTSADAVAPAVAAPTITTPQTRAPEAHALEAGAPEAMSQEESDSDANFEY